ncbi:MAG: hypothetical protein DRJ43_06000 [Thermoprotei archaeon]|nr:MAG: hypothetical protein DRJ43_06000 [Thermoprotei archaeon]
MDLILSTGTLHHIRDPEKVFRELTYSLRSNGEAWVYEFSHDAPWRDFKVTAKRLGRPALLIKFAAAMHGLPRKCFERGYIVRALRRAGVQYKLSYEAAMTKLILK